MKGTSMNTIWSSEIQGVMTLYLSRRLRFGEGFFGQFERAFGLDRDKKIRILEIGCGPGALAEALRGHYPNAGITGIDRDGVFLRFARENVPGAEFIEADAAALPFPDASFDVTVSYTVSEHIEPSAFYGEQRRVLKPGGVCLVLSARKGIRHIAPCLLPTPEEEGFWQRHDDGGETFRKYAVGAYAVSERELLRQMERYGFTNVTANWAVSDLTPDDAKFSPEAAEAIINAERLADREAVLSAHAPEEETEKVLGAIEEKYDERIRRYRAGEKEWDTNVSLTLIVRGTK